MCICIIVFSFVYICREVFKFKQEYGRWKYEGFNRETGGCENEGET